MFFSPELLAKRDSGFGLLWLAATLGSRTSLKKLSKRSVLTADIPGLCDLIAEPSEPHALRLTSNLMVGVVRVYKFKHEIFAADVNSCFVNLKKAVHELHVFPNNQIASYQMGHCDSGVDSFTLHEDPTLVVAFDLGNFEQNDWRESSTIKIREPKHSAENSVEYAAKSPTRAKSLSIERIRSAHTLEENYAHLLSSSDYINRAALLDPLSSRNWEFDFNTSSNDNNLFEYGSELDLNFMHSVGDDLAKELGEDWHVDSQQALESTSEFNHAPLGILEESDTHMVDGPMAADEAHIRQGMELITSQTYDTRDSLRTHSALFSPIAAEKVSPVLADDRGDFDPPRANPHLKRAGNLVDARIELTDKELKTARDTYTGSQASQRQEYFYKRLSKIHGENMKKLIFGVPPGLGFPTLMDFWQCICTNVIGVGHEDNYDERATKRRRLEKSDGDDAVKKGSYMSNEEVEKNADVRYRRNRSFEEVERGRNIIMRSSSLTEGAFNVDEFAFRIPDTAAEQDDNASILRDSPGFPGLEDSQGDALGFASSDGLSIGEAKFDAGSSFAIWQKSAMQKVAEHDGSRPGQLGLEPEELLFEDPPAIKSLNANSELMRNAMAFLQYCKGLSVTSAGNPSFSFQSIIPYSSTARAASSAFYHCLELATKHHLKLNQPKAYGLITIDILQCG